MTTATGVQLRKAAAAAINAQKALAAYVDGEPDFNAFSVEETYLPGQHQELGKLPEGGVLYLCLMAADDGPAVSRGSGLIQKTFPIQVGFQFRVQPTDVATMDKLVLLEEELRDTLRKMDPLTWQWQGAEALRDPNGTVFHYQGLHEGGYFESYYTARFLCLVE